MGDVRDLFPDLERMQQLRDDEVTALREAGKEAQADERSDEWAQAISDAEDLERRRSMRTHTRKAPKSEEQVEGETTKDYSILIAEAERVIAEAEMSKRKLARMDETARMIDEANEMTKWPVAN